MGYSRLGGKSIVFFLKQKSQVVNLFRVNYPFLNYPEDCPMDENGKPIYSKEVAVIAIPDNPEKKIKDLSDLVILNDKV